MKSEPAAAKSLPRPHPELVSRLSPIATSTLANALDRCGLHDNVVRHIKAVAPGFRFCGPAVTVKERAGGYGSFPSEGFRVGAMIDAAASGDVIVVDAGGAEASTWGGMASLAASLKGIAGLLVDGGVRDLEEMVAFDFPVFARHMLPTTGRTRLKVESINTAVIIDGVAVTPGDIVVADGTGVVIIPRERAEEIATLAEGFAKDDAAAMADLRAGMTFSAVMNRYKGI
ncbi:MAG: RraA family protein [Methyloligellaceae bacterium]